MVFVKLIRPITNEVFWVNAEHIVAITPVNHGSQVWFYDNEPADVNEGAEEIIQSIGARRAT